MTFYYWIYLKKTDPESHNLTQATISVKTLPTVDLHAQTLFFSLRTTFNNICGVPLSRKEYNLTPTVF